MYKLNGKQYERIIVPSYLYIEILSRFNQ